MDKLLNLIGLAKKAGKLEVGEEPVGAAARSKHARLILIASDAADNTRRRALHFGEAGECICLEIPPTKEDLGRALGRTSCALLALTRYLLPDELDTAAPGITARMERELDARILTPYFTSHFWWMGNGEEPMCNWTSWCTQNVLLTVFLLPTTQQQRKAAVKQAAYSLDCFLKDYGADGCCNEGAQY